MDKIDKFISWLLRLINKTILRGYNERRWDKNTKVQGTVVTYEDWEADKEWDYEEYRDGGS
jgi:hypothetical protein